MAPSGEQNAPEVTISGAGGAVVVVIRGAVAGGEVGAGFAIVVVGRVVVAVINDEPVDVDVGAAVVDAVVDVVRVVVATRLLGVLLPPPPHAATKVTATATNAAPKTRARIPVMNPPPKMNAHS